VQEYAVAEKFDERSFGTWNDLDKYYSIEIAIEGLEVVYQYGIWGIESSLMFFLVKENSGILPWLKVGDVLKMKYYSTDILYPFENFDTEIQSIMKQDQGRLKGHYLVGFEIVEEDDSPLV
jgi:hypothetical protein